jgi:hypothetical protein
MKKVTLLAGATVGLAPAALMFAPNAYAKTHEVTCTNAPWLAFAVAGEYPVCFGYNGGADYQEIGSVVEECGGNNFGLYSDSVNGVTYHSVRFYNGSTYAPMKGFDKKRPFPNLKGVYISRWSGDDICSGI